MDLVAVIAAITSLAGAVTTVVLGARFERGRQREQRELNREESTNRYAQPLLAAANSLASRIGNATPEQIGEFTTAEGDRGERYSAYLLYETLYRIGRYLCWRHIIYREVRGLDLGSPERNRELAVRMAGVGSAMSDRSKDSVFMLLGGEQDAIGEVLVERDPGNGEPRCMSYVTFEKRMLAGDPELTRWFAPLQRDLATFLQAPERGADRLTAIRSALNALIDLLDPEKIWLPFRAHG